MIEAPSNSPDRRLVAAAFVAVYLIWGSTYLAIRFAVETLPPFLMAGVRFTVAGGILYLFLRLRGGERPKLIHWRSASIVGALLFLIDNGGVCWAEQHVSSSVTVLLLTTVPVWMVLLDWVRPGGDRPALIDAAGIALGIAGVAFLVSAADIGEGKPVHWLGATVLLVASLSWAIGSVYSRHAPLPASPLLTASMQMISGGAFLLLAGFLSDEVSRVRPDAISLLSVASLAYLTVFGAIVAFPAYVFLLRVSTAAKVSTFAFANPVVAVVLGCTLGEEPITSRTLGASAVIIATATILTIRRSARATPPRVCRRGVTATDGLHESSGQTIGGIKNSLFSKRDHRPLGRTTTPSGRSRWERNGSTRRIQRVFGRTEDVRSC